MESETLASPEVTARWRRPRVWIIGIVLLALAAIIVYQSYTFISAPPARRGRFQDGGNQPVGVARVRKGDIRLIIRALGAVTPLTTVTVTPQISGVLMKVGFKEGQTVH
jgi:multidrug efflux system membrane fusion protein